MKKLMFASNQHILTMKLVIDIKYKTTQIAADVEFKELTHPNIKRKYKKSDEWVKQVNDIVRSIIGSMQGRKFKIVKAYPSKKSYTYYIRFQPADKNGDLWDQVVEFQIELRDHRSDDHEDIGQVTEQLLVKTYYLGDKQYLDAYKLMKSVWKLLDQLSKGDFSSFIV